MKDQLNLNKIPQLLARSCAYRIDVPWESIEGYLESVSSGNGPTLDLNPDFQRGHVWDIEQRSAYVEFCLRGGSSGRDLYFNSPGWTSGSEPEGPYVIVDGLQRLTTVQMFLRDEVPIFGGHMYGQCLGHLRMHQCFKWHVNELETRAEVLNWYLEINAGGTPHTDTELNRVRALLSKEKS